MRPWRAMLFVLPFLSTTAGWCACGVSGTTLTAASAAESDVAACAAVLAAGDTLVIPSGSSTWTTQLNVTIPNASSSSVVTTIEGLTVCTGSGDPAYNNLSCTDGTTITDNVSGNNPALTIVPAATGEVRITGITIGAASGNTVYHGTLNFSTNADATSPGVRIDHNHFTGASTGDIELDGTEYGVIDHNVFTETQDDENAVRVYNGGNWNGATDGFGHASWADSDHYGTNEFVVIEQNYFYMSVTGNNYQILDDCSVGGRFVARFNTVGYHTTAYTHGTSGSGGAYRGCRTFEIYANSLSWDPSGTYGYNSTGVMNIESGTGLIWGNTVAGQEHILNEDNSRSGPYSETSPPAGWGYCGSDNGGPSAWDGNNPSSTTGYPCLDQPGRGEGDLLEGNFSEVCDETTGCSTYDGAWPNQALDPVYMWTNTYDSHLTAYWSNSDNHSLMTNNQDYYFPCGSNNSSCSSFTGAYGVGSGPLASMPSTCTTGVAYWATDQGNWNSSGNGFGQGELYICTATNTWTESYEPYTYPHPLEGGLTLSPPTNLQGTPTAY